MLQDRNGCPQNDLLRKERGCLDLIFPLEFFKPNYPPSRGSKSVDVIMALSLHKRHTFIPSIPPTSLQRETEVSDKAKDSEATKRLWAISERWTGLS